MFPKHNHIRSKAIRQSANGETCTWPGCNAPAQCWAHSNLGSDGKGMRIKADDIYGAYLCDYHHNSVYDAKLWDYEEPEDRQYDFDQAMKKSWKILINKGIIKIKDHECD